MVIEFDFHITKHTKKSAEIHTDPKKAFGMASWNVITATGSFMILQFNPFTPVNASYRFYSVYKRQTILLVNGEPPGSEWVNSKGIQHN